MIANFIIDTINAVLNNTILKLLPVEISGLSLNQFTAYLSEATTNLAGSFNFLNNFINFKLLFLLLAFIIGAEILLHFGFKAVKYIINLFRGSGA
jgi:hypothetical protein